MGYACSSCYAELSGILAVILTLLRRLEEDRTAFPTGDFNALLIVDAAAAIAATENYPFVKKWDINVVTAIHTQTC